ncbi:hypothetical protein, partial [Escherichia coli]|uniref:hypothetical protein n=1 Tax=Escherichia coli TaxID=562 RepID=UPI001BC856E9
FFFCSFSSLVFFLTSPFFFSALLFISPFFWLLTQPGFAFRFFSVWNNVRLGGLWYQMFYIIYFF